MRRGAFLSSDQPVRPFSRPALILRVRRHLQVRCWHHLLRGARAIFFLSPVEAPWPPFEAPWPPATVAETLRCSWLPYTDRALYDAVFRFYVDNLAPDELVSFPDFLD